MSKRLISIIGGIACIGVVIISGGISYLVLHQQRVQHSSQIAECMRVQHVREDGNLISYLAYVGSVTSAARQRRIVATAKDPAVVKSSRQGVKFSTVIAAKLRYEPPTDCEKAVGEPGTYRRPRSVPWKRVPDRNRPVVGLAPLIEAQK